MKVIDPQSAMLANHEVLAHVQVVREKNASKQEYTATKVVTTDEGTPRTELSGKLRGLNHIVTELSRYFESSHGYTGGTNTADKTANPKVHEPTQQLLRNLKPYNLTKTELLMLLNLRPQAVDQLEPLVEEVGERFSVEEQLEIVRIIEAALGNG